MPHPIVFLDIDGVINSAAWFAKQRDRGITIMNRGIELIDHEAVRHLNALVIATDARIVVSSSWRCENMLSDIRGWLKSRGLLGQIIDKTPVIGHRGHEISAWLRTAPVGTQYVILDDEPDLDTHPGRWVHVDYDVGLSEADVDRAMEILGSTRSTTVVAITVFAKHCPMACYYCGFKRDTCCYSDTHCLRCNAPVSKPLNA